MGWTLLRIIRGPSLIRWLNTGQHHPTHECRSPGRACSTGKTLCRDGGAENADKLGRPSRLPPAGENHDGMHGTRIAFTREVATPAMTREVFVEMVKQARQG